MKYQCRVVDDEWRGRRGEEEEVSAWVSKKDAFCVFLSHVGTKEKAELQQTCTIKDL